MGAIKSKHYLLIVQLHLF